jgi:hypothetical protein
MSGLDMIGALALTAAAATVGSALVPAGFSALRACIEAGGVLALWFGLVVAAAASLVFDQRLGFGLPALGTAVAVPVILGLLLAVYVPQLKAAIRAVPLPALIAVNTVRVAGIFLLLLYFLGRLPAPFAPTAGYGDIAIGLSAPFVAWMASRQARGWRGLALVWNALGLLDLVGAVGLAVLTTDGSPVQLFFTTPSTATMTALPWILIPGFLVPLLALTHAAVFDRLWRASHVEVATGRVARAS